MNQADKSNVIHSSIQLLLGPIARFCLRHSVVVQEVLELLKQAMVHEAAKLMRGSGQKVNVSRVSVMTGLQRRDVMRLMRGGHSELAPLSLAGRVIGQWEQDMRFRSMRGAPRVLTYEGDQSEFKELVRCVSQDLNHCTVLFELERVGAVERTSKGVKLLRSSLQLSDDMRQGLQLMARDCNDLMESATKNIFHKPEVPELHARTEYDNVIQSALPQIKKWLLQEGALFHRRAREYISSFDKHINTDLQGEAGARIVLGTFGRVEIDKGDTHGHSK